MIWDVHVCLWCLQTTKGGCDLYLRPYHHSREGYVFSYPDSAHHNPRTPGPAVKRSHTVFESMPAQHLSVSCTRHSVCGRRGIALSTNAPRERQGEFSWGPVSFCACFLTGQKLGLWSSIFLKVIYPVMQVSSIKYISDPWSSGKTLAVNTWVGSRYLTVRWMSFRNIPSMTHLQSVADC